MSESAPEPVVRHIAFEALFVHGISVDETLGASLRTAGFDLKAQKPEYPFSVLGRCLEVTAAQHYASMTSAEASRAIGNRFIGGILSTMLGKVVGVAVLLSGPDRTVKRIPSLIKSDYGVTVTAAQLGPKHYQVSSPPGYPRWAGHFFHGIFEAALVRTNVTPESSARVDAQSGAFVIDLKWA